LKRSVEKVLLKGAFRVNRADKAIWPDPFQWLGENAGQFHNGNFC